jgi:GTP cyclohydrolase I
MIDESKLQHAAELILEGLGVDRLDRNFVDTPRRFAKVWKELFEPDEITIPVFPENCTDLVVMSGFHINTVCPHHLVPVRLVFSTGYVPNGHVIGASKLIRLVHHVNRYPMTQEKLTQEVARCMDEMILGNRGIAVFASGHHGCMELRGVRQTASMKTSKFLGAFHEDYAFQNRFLDMVRSVHE